MSVEDPAPNLLDIKPGECLMAQTYFLPPCPYVGHCSMARNTALPGDLLKQSEIQYQSHTKYSRPISIHTAKYMHRKTNRQEQVISTKSLYMYHHLTHWPLGFLIEFSGFSGWWLNIQSASAKLTVKFFFFFFTWNFIFARDISSLLVPGLGTIFSSTKRRLIWITWTSMSTVQDRQLNLITDSLPTKMINAAVFLPVFFCFNYWGSNLWILL